MSGYPKIAKGAETGLGFPTTIESLRELGTDFLTAAFRATGAITENNRVSAITEWKEFHGGGMGRKLLLSVEYATAGDRLDHELFIKFPLDYGDPLRPLFTPLMQSEVRFALLSRRHAFPVTTPKCYFGDYDSNATTGLLVSARVPFGRSGVEIARDKAMDYEFSDPLPYYCALARAMGRLAGRHKAGLLGDLSEIFPNASAEPTVTSSIPFDENALPEKLEQLRAFAASAPQLFPDDLRSTTFLDRFATEVPMVFAMQEDMRAYLAHESEYVALCHPNMNVDNAWFWPDGVDRRQVGLLDWGGVAQMNLAQAVYGMICCGELEFNRRYAYHLVQLVVNEFREAGGPQISADKLLFMLRLSISFLGVAWTLNAPTIIESVVPDYALARSRFDPKLRDNFLGRVQTQCLMVFLNEWRNLDIGSALRRFAAGRRD